MREIPTLQVLCLRAVGSHDCSIEKTFEKIDGNSAVASRLLRSFHDRGITKDGMSATSLPRIPCMGPGSSRRLQSGHQVDLHHPLGAYRTESTALVLREGNPALDVLQAYVDSLVDLGRMDDGRLGKNFFAEFKENVPSGHKAALSLHNCTVGINTKKALQESNLGAHVCVLDLTGVQGLSDDMCTGLWETFTELTQLSLKNGRRLTCKSLQTLTPKLQVLDVGGCFNITCEELLTKLEDLKSLVSLHASGLGWTNLQMEALVKLPNRWKDLSFGFTTASSIHPGLSSTMIRQNLMLHANTLVSLCLCFCESVVDNALLGILGRNVPSLMFLDLRGNTQLSTVTGWYDGRASADLPHQNLSVLGRYTSLTPQSVEDTKRIHPLMSEGLQVVLDAGGIGLALEYVATKDEQTMDTS